MRRAETAVLLERERELGELGAAVEDVSAGNGRLVLLEGPPGIGKTRLLEALRARAAEHRMTVLAARASELDRDFPFGVVRQLFEPALAGADAERRATLLRGAAARATGLFGETPAESKSVDPAWSHLHALYWLTANFAEEAPIALAIDDVHWADAESMRFLGFLLPRLAELPVLVALAARPPEAGTDRSAIDAVATDPVSVVLRPAPLSDDAVAAMVAVELGAEPDRGFRDACRSATGGNPFLLRELLRELAAERVAPNREAVPLVRAVAPPTVARAVLLRLARLGDEASALAHAVAVLGDGAPLRRAAALAGLPEDRVGELASVLAQASVLAPARPLEFAHPILRSAVYADIEPGKRADAHRRAAALLDGDGAAVDEIAVHLLSAEPTGDRRVVETLREAASAALDRGAPATAVACLRRAIAEPPEVVERASLLRALASAELRAGDPSSAAQHFDEVVRMSDDPRERAACAMEWAVALQALGRHDEAYAVRERAVAEVAAVDRELALSIEVSLIATAGLDLSRLGWARERLEPYRGRLSAATAAECGLLALRTYHQSMYGEAAAEPLADVAERLLTSGQLVDRTTNRGTTPFFAAVEVLWLADRAGPARAALERLADEARRRGSALGYASAVGWRCRLLARDGALAEAEADARSCAELSLSQGWFAMAPPMLGYVLDVLIDRGELDDAERVLEGSGLAGRDPGGDVSFYPAVHARARLRAARGDLEGAREDLAVLRRRRACWNTAMTLLPPVLVAPGLATRDASEAGEAESMLREAERWGTPRAIGMALRAAGLLQPGRAGIEMLERAAAVLEDSPARLEHARALADLGAALRRSNRSADAREPLRRALDVADACGALRDAERARQELRAAGGRPRRSRLTGPGALTASELRIATMAAEGLSNREIAQALFVTKKTVETHLGSAYRKLGIRSRDEIAAALRA